MRERCKDSRRQKADSPAMVWAIGAQLWARATNRPMDSFAALGAGIAVLTIVVNAVFMQSGAKSAPFVATPAPLPVPAVADAAPVASPQDTLKSADMAPVHTAALPPKSNAVLPTNVPLPPRRNDPIADLIGSSQQRVQAVQRALSEYGYGQLKASGTVDEATHLAISKFEREHKLPVTGRISEKLVAGLSALAGHAID